MLEGVSKRVSVSQTMHASPQSSARSLREKDPVVNSTVHQRTELLIASNQTVCTFVRICSATARVVAVGGFPIEVIFFRKILDVAVEKIK